MSGPVLALRRRALLRAAFAAGPLAALPASASRAADPGAKARAYFGDTVLLAQDARAVRFYSDVLKDRVVLINFVFTECGEACPLITQKLLHARQLLGTQSKSVRFVSISVDPENDTPQTLTAFATKQGALMPEWMWLTGAKANVDAVTKRLGAYSENRNSHLTGLILGNLRNDRWTRVQPDATSAQIASELRRIGELAPAPGR
jgi:protein SCO1